MSGAAKRAHTSLQERIVTGKIAPGTLLSENQLSSELGLSRTPIRAALSRLQDDGGVRILPQRGARVLGLDEDQVSQLTRAFAALEGGAVREASDDGLRDAATSLTSIVAEQRDALRRLDAAALVSSSEAFHTRVVAAASNAYLDHFAAQLTLQRQRLLHAQGRRLFERGEALIAEHERLAVCLAEGDREGYIAALDAHLHAMHHSPEASAARCDGEA